METDQDMYPDPQEDKENNNTANGKPLDNIARKESYMRLLNKIEEIRKCSSGILYTRALLYFYKIYTLYLMIPIPSNFDKSTTCFIYALIYVRK